MAPMRAIFTADRLWDGSQLIELPIVIAEDGLVVSIASGKEAAVPKGQLHAFPGLTLGPAFSTFTSTAPPAMT